MAQVDGGNGQGSPLLKEDDRLQPQCLASAAVVGGPHAQLARIAVREQDGVCRREVEVVVGGHLKKFPRGGAT